CDNLEGSLDDMTMVEINLSDEAIVRMNSSALFAKTSGAVCLVLGIGALIVSVYISDFKVARPLISTNKTLKKISTLIDEGNGDLTMRMSVKSKDEIGQLAEGINQFLEILQRTIGKIVSGSSKLEETVGSVSAHVTSSNDSAQDVSSAMEELS